MKKMIELLTISDSEYISVETYDALLNAEV
jgi:hypothetical protein